MNQLTSLKKYLFAMFCLVVLIAGFLWFRGHAFIEVTVGGDSGSGNLSYYLTNQANGKTSFKQTPAKTYKKLVTRGSYNTTVLQSNSSFFAIKDTGGFLKTTHVSGTLRGEVSRQFFGTNPSECTEKLGDRLVSYVCGGLLGSVKIHMPASASLPTYTLTNPNASDPNGYGYVGGFLTINGQQYAVLKRPASSDLGSGYFIGSISSNLDISGVQKLDLLNPDNNYSFTSYRSGYLAYDSGFTHIHYFESPSSSAQEISIDKAKNKNLEPLALTTNAKSIAVLYGSKTDPKVKNNASEVVIWNDGKSTSYTFDKGYSQLTFCATQKICLVNNEGLAVYDISSERATFAYFIWGVVKVVCNTDGICLAAQRNQLLDLNINGASGYTAFSFGDYRYNDLTLSGGSFILTTTGPDDKKVALLIDPMHSDSQQIDKKVGELEKRTDIISNVSAYGRYVFISPNFGAFTRNPTTGRYGYDPAVKQRVSTEIDTVLGQININPKDYSVIVIGGN